MLEDKLSQAQRIRLEALALANETTPRGVPAEVVMQRARKYEEYVKNGGTPDGAR